MRNAIALSLLVLSACASSSPSIIGTWRFEGKATQQLTWVWTDVTFSDTSMTVRFIPAASPFAGMMDPYSRAKFARPKTATFPYEKLANGDVRFVDDGQAQELKTEVKDGKLYLTPVMPSSGNAQVDAAAQAPTQVFDRVK